MRSHYSMLVCIEAPIRTVHWAHSFRHPLNVQSAQHSFDRISNAHRLLCFFFHSISFHYSRTKTTSYHIHILTGANHNRKTRAHTAHAIVSPEPKTIAKRKSQHCIFAFHIWIAIYTFQSMAETRLVPRSGCVPYSVWYDAFACHFAQIRVIKWMETTE